MSFEEIVRGQGLKDLNLMFDIEGFPESPTPRSGAVTRSPSIENSPRRLSLNSTLEEAGVVKSFSTAAHTETKANEAQSYASSPQARIQIESEANDKKEFESAPLAQSSDFTMSRTKAGSKFERFIQRFSKMGVVAPQSTLRTPDARPQRPFSLFIGRVHRKTTSAQA
jgi:hypothetical protein